MDPDYQPVWQGSSLLISMNKLKMFGHSLPSWVCVPIFAHNENHTEYKCSNVKTENGLISVHLLFVYLV